METGMALFVGRHVNKIDKKGRVSVPKTFRAALQAQGSAVVYAYPLFKHAAIEACGEAFMERLSASLEDSDMERFNARGADTDVLSEEQNNLVAMLLEDAHVLSFDPEGRVILPKELVDYAGMSDEAVFIGRGARFQIWSPTAYEPKRRPSVGRVRGAAGGG